MRAHPSAVRNRAREFSQINGLSQRTTAVVRRLGPDHVGHGVEQGHDLANVAGVVGQADAEGEHAVRDVRRAPAELGSAGARCEVVVKDLVRPSEPARPWLRCS